MTANKKKLLNITQQCKIIEAADINRQTHWQCDECEAVYPYVDADGCNDDPFRLDSGPPHFNLIGCYCEDCIGTASEEYEADLLASRGDPLEYDEEN